MLVLSLAAEVRIGLSLHVGYVESAEARATRSGRADSNGPSSRKGETLPQDLEIFDRVVPLEIVVDDDFTERKQVLANSRQIETVDNSIGLSHVHVETIVSGYALDILEEKLPEPLAECYINMTNEVMESGTHSPAAYGDKLCG